MAFAFLFIRWQTNTKTTQTVQNDWHNNTQKINCYPLFGEVTYLLFSRINTNRSKFSDPRFLLKSLSLVSLRRIRQRGRVYCRRAWSASIVFKKNFNPRWNTGEDSNCICVFHVGFVTIQSSIALLRRRYLGSEDIWPFSVGDIWPFSVGVILNSCKTREAYKIQLSTHFFDTQIKYN